MKTEQLNEWYNRVTIQWKPENGIRFIRQPYLFHTIQEALTEIAKISYFNTIEEKIAKLIDKKRKVLDSVLDGKVTESESLLSELMKDYE